MYAAPFAFRKEKWSRCICFRRGQEEEPLSKGSVSVHDLIDVDGYLCKRMRDLPVPTVCEPCKALAIQ